MAKGWITLVVVLLPLFGHTETASCSTTCANGGTCVSTNTCSCRYPYLEPYCQSMCSHTCYNGGFCKGPQTCQCEPHFFGPLCKTDCSQSKAEVMFVLDSSSSLGHQNYSLMLSFVKSLIKNQAIGNTSVRVGLLTYSDYPEIRISLNDSVKFHQKDLLDVVGNMTYIPGITATKNALYLLEQEGFKHARPNSPHIAILITDGHSFNISETAYAALAVRAKGIQLFTIAVGTEISKQEIDSIASDSHTTHEYKVKSFADLNSIIENVTVSICAVHTSGRITEPPPASTPVPPLIKSSVTLKECKGKRNDVLFLLDTSNGLSLDNFDKVKLYVEDIVALLNIVENQRLTQVGVMTFSNYPAIRIDLGQFNEKRKLIEAIRSMDHFTGETETDTALELAQLEGFENHRPDTPDIVIIITQGLSAKPYLTKYAADALKASGKTVIVTAIGANTTLKNNEENYIASEPRSAHTFFIDDFTGLKGIEEKIARTICTACSPKNADVVFMLDSSGSIGEANFNLMKGYVKQAIAFLHIGVNTSNVGVISYSSVAQTEFSMGTYSTKYLLDIAVDNIKYLSGSTDTGAALELMRHNAFANDRQGYPNIAILVTDGKSKDRFASIQQARLAKQVGITIVAIGIGYNIDPDELTEIASPDSTNNQSLVYLVDAFNQLHKLDHVVPNVACGVALESNVNEYTTPAPTYVPSITHCTDTFDNCASYGADVCSDYRPWATAHCPLHCGFCRGGPTKPGQCVDKIHNCQSYGTYFCKDLSFYTWAKENCAKYCALCGSGTIPTDPPTSTPVAPKASVCADSFNNCNEYGGKSMCTNIAERQWAKDHCAEYCGFCNIYSMVSSASVAAHNHTCPNWRLPSQCTLESNDGSCCAVPKCPADFKLTVKGPDTLAPTCTDTVNNCDQYSSEYLCKNVSVKAWTTKHCPKYCGVCSDYKVIKGTHLAATNTQCPDWLLLKDCFMSTYDKGCCPMPTCPTGYVLTVKPPLETD